MNKEKQAIPSIKKRILIGLAGGLYPFLHFYGNNFNIANSKVQFLFLVTLCLLVPIVISILLPYVFRLPFLRRWLPHGTTIFNLLYFMLLLGLLIFHFNSGMFTAVLLGVALIGFLLFRFLNQILILQFLLAGLSLFMLIPNLYFAYSYDDRWTEIEEDLGGVTFKQHPNIYMIQPDGYVNFSELRKPPYNDADMGFEKYLEEQGFVNYKNFRSNYFTTLTSNSSTFAMKHHYYQNLSKSSAKTFGTMEVIVGENNVLQILKNNNYTTHLFTDNSFFLLNRKMNAYDYCNISKEELPFHRLGRLPNVDILSEFQAKLAEKPLGPNFFFIEKITPGHISNAKGTAGGIEKGRKNYLRGVQQANEWLTSLIRSINNHDANAMIIIMADHGGSVGLAYSDELKHRMLNGPETASVFSVLMSVKWPNNQVPVDLDFKSNVNTFRNLFYYLSEDPVLMKSYQPDISYLYNLNRANMQVYQCIDEDGNYGYVNMDHMTQKTE